MDGSFIPGLNWHAPQQGWLREGVGIGGLFVHPEAAVGGENGDLHSGLLSSTVEASHEQERDDEAT